MFLGEGFKTFLENALHDLQEAWTVPTFPAHSLHLEQQTFLQGACTDAGRIHALQHCQHLFNLCFAHIDIVIDSQFVADAAQILTQQTVIIKASDEIFHHSMLLVGECEHIHLLFQLVIK